MSELANITGSVLVQLIDKRLRGRFPLLTAKGAVQYRSLGGHAEAYTGLYRLTKEHKVVASREVRRARTYDSLQMIRAS